MPYWNLSRRDIIRLGALGAGSLILPVARLGPTLASGNTSSPPVTPFKMALPIPVAPGALAVPTGVKTPVLTPAPNSVTLQADTYLLEARVTETQVLPPSDGFGPTQGWGYNGQVPGPTFLLNRDQPVVVTFKNNLGAANTGRPTDVLLSTHLHGGYVDGFSDGHPDLVVPPGQSKRHTYYNAQPAAPLWYHDHDVDHTSRNVYYGLFGVYLLSDDNERSLNLPANNPSREEFFDIPLVIQSKFFNSDASLNFPPGDNPSTTPILGTVGDVVLVNGVAWPFLDVQPRRYRFRLWNGSNAREFQLALSNGQSFIQIGTEGGLLPTPIVQREIHITPAERYEVVVDFAAAAGQTITMVNKLESGKLGLVMQFRVGSGSVVDTSNPLAPGTRLMAPDLLDRFNALRALGIQFLAGQASGKVPAQIAQVRSFRWERGNGGFQINGQFFDPNRDDAAPRRGTFEVWKLENDSGGWFHPVHIHLLHAGFGFVVLDRNGVPITAADQEWGWKETVDVGRNNDNVHILMQWPAVPVNPNNSSEPQLPNTRDFTFFEKRYVFHCHVMDHEDFDMMGQLRVDG
jgi:FtsP/CotA-like multicopper oxidase with cupredoxin domain